MTNPVIPILLSLAGAIAVFVFLLSDRKYAHLPKWAQVLQVPRGALRGGAARRAPQARPL